MPPAPTRLQPPGRRVLAAAGLCLAVLALHMALLGWLPLGAGGPGRVPPGLVEGTNPGLLQVRSRVLAAGATEPAPWEEPATAAASPPATPATTPPAAAPAPQAPTTPALPAANPPAKAVAAAAPRAAPPPAPMEEPAGADGDALAGATTAFSEGEPQPLPAGPPPLTYATRLPPPAVLQYTVQREGPGLGAGPAAAVVAAAARQGLQAQLIWRPEPATATYTLSLGLGAVGTASVGGLDLHGLAPERHVETRRGRELRAANFQRQPAAEGGGRITFSGPRIEHPLWPGVQDRLSWLLQLPAVLAAEPGLGQPGREVLLLVVGVRGEAAPWVFRVVGSGPLALPAGVVAEALHLQRTPRHAHDTQVDVWLDPARHHLPVRWRLQHRADGPATEFSLLQMALP